jgi:hypothetical protein
MKCQKKNDTRVNRFQQSRTLLLQWPAVWAAHVLLLLSFLGTLEVVRAQDDDDEVETSEEAQKLPAQEQEFSARGFNTLRIEQEDKISVPSDKAEEVWNFLYAHFIVDTTALKALDPRLTAYFNEEHFADTYFDTPTLQLYEMQSGVRHRKRENLSNANDRKSGRELMQIKVSNISANSLERGEFKYKIHYPTQVKVAEDRHPMLGIIKPSQRDEFKTRLQNMGLDPYSMRPIVTVYDQRKRIYFQRDQKTLMSISFDQVKAELLWAKADFIEIEPELNEVAFTEADSATRVYMEETNARISALLKEKFPYLKSDLTPKYNKSLDRLAAEIPWLRVLIHLNMDNMPSVIVAATGLCLAAITGGLFLAKRFFSNKTGRLVSSSFSI